MLGRQRREQDILPVIQHFVATDPEHPTIVYSDHWGAYNHLDQHNYEHRRVNDFLIKHVFIKKIKNHSRSFGFGTFTTNNIENYWSRLKRLPRFMQSIRGDLADAQNFINVSAWRIIINHMTKQQRQQELIDAIHFAYPF